MWEWLIAETRTKFPDLVFLSEAFTKPKMMRVLAKAGFSQSYTYFTWRNTKQELTEYLSEVSAPWSADYFRPNFFTNTPDILPFFLQQDGRTPFMIRAVLAATLSPLYGIYSGFELCENAALPGREEYLDSEKYQFKQRDWNAPGNIKGLITRLNAARRGNPALQHLTNLRFHTAENDRILFFAKATADNVILVAVNLGIRLGVGCRLRGGGLADRRALDLAWIAKLRGVGSFRPRGSRVPSRALKKKKPAPQRCGLYGKMASVQAAATGSTPVFWRRRHMV
jgi:starch synthase (maltosyl-transferring)